MTGPRLAIIVDSAAKPSETFIRDHIRCIAPGRTLVVSSDDSAADQPALAALTGIGGTGRAHLKSAALARLRRVDFADIWPLPLHPGDEARLIAFLRDNGTTHVLVEYLHVSAQLMGPLTRAGFAVWTHAHGMDLSGMTRIRRLRGALRRAMTDSEGLFVPSHALAGIASDLGLAARQIFVSPCGVDPDRFAPGRPEPGRCVMVGRLIDKKAPLISLAAFAAIARDHPDARLDIVGDGPLRAECEAFVARHGLGARVTLHGAIDHARVRALMARAQIFLQHSVTTPQGDREGLPVAVLEAMSSGLAVLSTRHSGIPEAVTDGTDGILVEERDTEAYTAALGRLLGDPDGACVLGQAARAAVLARFTHARMSERIRAAMGLPRDLGES